MKPWHAAAMTWAYIMAACAGSYVMGNKFFSAMVAAGAFGALAAFMFSVLRDLKR